MKELSVARKHIALALTASRLLAMSASAAVPKGFSAGKATLTWSGMNNYGGECQEQKTEVGL